MGYVACIEAQVVLCSAFHFIKKMLSELRDTGDYTELSQAEFVVARQDVEDIIGLTEYYEIESNTVEKKTSEVMLCNLNLT
jgi:methylisocitrate lyase